MRLTFASYNIHKGVGLDRQRDPDRIVSILREIDADVIALQEADRRFGSRESVIPRQTIDDHTPWRPVAPATMPASLGWHGNVLLVRRGIEVRGVQPVALPMLEPRGAVCAEMEVEGRVIRVVGMHLDLSGLRRRHQVRAVCDHALEGGRFPTVMMGDLNEWAPRGGALSAFAHPLKVLAPGRSFPSRRPVAQLDRIVVSEHWEVEDHGVHHSALAAVGSDHLPVWARLSIGA